MAGLRSALMGASLLGLAACGQIAVAPALREPNASAVRHGIITAPTIIREKHFVIPAGQTLRVAKNLSVYADTIDIQGSLVVAKPGVRFALFAQTIAIEGIIAGEFVGADQLMLPKTTNIISTCSLKLLSPSTPVIETSTGDDIAFVTPAGGCT